MPPTAPPPPALPSASDDANAAAMRLKISNRAEGLAEQSCEAYTRMTREIKKYGKLERGDVRRSKSPAAFQIIEQSSDGGPGVQITTTSDHAWGTEGYATHHVRCDEVVEARDARAAWIGEAAPLAAPKARLTLEQRTRVERTFGPAESGHDAAGSSSASSHADDFRVMQYVMDVRRMHDDGYEYRFSSCDETNDSFWEHEACSYGWEMRAVLPGVALFRHGIKKVCFIGAAPDHPAVVGPLSKGCRDETVVQ